jgi:transcriptional regulator with XRE-family HTH domain
MAAPKKDLPPLGARLRAVRERAGLSQQALAKLLGEVQSSVSAFETGDSIIPLPTLKKWLVRLGVERDEWGDFIDAVEIPGEAA